MWYLEKLANIKLNPKNPRKISEAKFQKLVESIKKFPKMLELRPVVLDADKMVLGGNMRIKACIAAGREDVPAIDATNLTAEEQREFIVKDNISYGDIDWEIMAKNYQEAELIEWGVDMPELKVAPQGWNPDKTEGAELGDGINELVGYGLQSFWKDITNENSELHPHWIDLPVQEVQNLVKQKYSRTNLEEIRRVIKTYMREGDYFLESCAGWSTFSKSAVLHGFNGIGTDIWDVAIAHGNKQYAALPAPKGEYKCIYGDAKALPFEDNTFDFVYCNPPFMDIEKYGGTDEDIAEKDINKFGAKFTRLMIENFRVLKPGNLCVITINDKRENGFLLPIQKHIIEWGMAANFKLWDFVIAEVQSQKIRLRKKDYELRRTVKCHEYVIVFKKPGKN